MKRVAGLCVCVSIVGGAPFTSEAVAQDKQQPKLSASDRALDNELLKSLESLPPNDPDPPIAREQTQQGGATSEESKPAATNTSDDSSLDGQLFDDLGGAEAGPPSKAQNPLIRIERKMRTVEKRLTDARADRETADMQRQILDELEQFTQQCKAACKSGEKGKKSSKSSGGNKPGATAGQAPSTTMPRDSSGDLQQRNTEFGDRRTATDSLKESWGHLPEHVRDDLLIPPSDVVLPRYEAMLKKYFQRLAEEDRNRP